MQLVIDRSQVKVEPYPQAGPGGKVMLLDCLNGWIVVIPLTDEASKSLASMLGSGIVVANSEIPEPPAWSLKGN